MQVNPHSQALALLDLDAVRGALGPAGADVAAAQAETKRQLEAQLQETLRTRYLELAEALFLSEGGNVMDFNPGDPALVASLRAADAGKPWGGARAEGALPAVVDRNRRKSSQGLAPSQEVVDAVMLPAVAQEEVAARQQRTGIKDGDLERVLKRAAVDMGVVRRVATLRLAGLWSDDLPSRPTEAQLPHAASKCHWDYMLDECVWLAKEVAGERRWKRNAAKRVAVAARKGLQQMRLVTGGTVGSVFDASKQATVTGGVPQPGGADAQLERSHRAISHTLAQMMQRWWGSIHELLAHKQQAALELEKRAAVNKHLEEVVDQTAKFSSLVADTLHQPVPLDENERDYMEGSDSDELGTLLAAEAEEDAAAVQEEVDALQREMDMDIDELLARYKRQERHGHDHDEGDGDDGAKEDEGTRPPKRAKDDRDDFVEGSDEDELGTLLDAEAEEDRGEVQAEVDALQQEMDMDINELMARYKRPAHDSAEEEMEDDEEEEEEEEEEEAAAAAVAERGDAQELPAKRARDDDAADFQEGSDEDELGTLLDAEAEEDRGEVQAEVDALQQEMDMDINELMARYKREPEEPVVDADEEGDEEEGEEEDGEDAGGLLEMDEGSSCEGDGAADVADGGPELYGTSLLLDSTAEGRTVMEGAAREAQTAQPTGTTLATCAVRTQLPSLLRGPPLREYQHIGLDWLVAMYEKGLNGILADEMGLGKTVMTISLLGHLAEKRGIWGPHLVVVPTSVLLNWEKEFKFWFPAFKILTYYGSTKQRQLKRTGWSRPGAFHVCITTYNIILQDSSVFRRRPWHYLILDEAHNIRNFKSKRWQTLLALRARRRLLLTGTPLQNNLMELWSLLHFLMPHIFQSHSEFKQWFASPMDAMIEGKQEVDHALIERLHSVLRPFLLRRLKKDVERQLPDKHEHVVLCRLSKRQRGLYEEFLASRRVRDTLSGGNVLGVMNILMQLRKVCNHPDLFEERPIVSPFDVGVPLLLSVSRALVALVPEPALPALWRPALPSWFASFNARATDAQCAPLEAPPSSSFNDALQRNRALSEQHRLHSSLGLGCDVVAACEHVGARRLDLVLPLAHQVDGFGQRLLALAPEVTFVIPKARALTPELVVSSIRHRHAASLSPREQRELLVELKRDAGPYDTSRVAVRQQLYFPDKRLVQYDCGKLQELAALLERLRAGGHRVLIFTQMTRMLDVLETFLTFHHYPYLRLDGSTRTDRRYAMMERFNEDKRLFCFILSTRSGGLGINLTGADTVVFFDSDWNPAMDAQAQDRCHRIGQTRTVHIYRLISSKTVEENILRKAWQKRQLERVTLAEGGFNVTALAANKVDLRELIGDGAGGLLLEPSAAPAVLQVGDKAWTEALAAVEDDADRDAAVAALREQVEEAQEYAPSAPLRDAVADEWAELDQRIAAQLDPVQRFALRLVESEAPHVALGTAEGKRARIGQ